MTPPHSRVTYLGTGQPEHGSPTVRAAVCVHVCVCTVPGLRQCILCMQLGRNRSCLKYLNMRQPDQGEPF
jgi:hypothetical protein